nr:TonB family protein [Bryobacter sp.]
AEVRIEQIGGEYKTSVPTNDTGEFAFPTLAPGEYRVLILKPGFASVMKVARIKPVEATRLNFVLQLGRVSEEMSVTGERPAGAAAASAGTPKQIRVGGNVQATKLIQRPRPAYPAECKAEGVEGSVMLEAIISRTGTIENLRQINQDVDPRLVQAAIEAVKNWQYQPTLLNGEPVEVITAITVNFTLAK